MVTEAVKRLGILTSGGDCPGLNAVIRAVVKSANRRGWEVYGIPYGTDGFIALAQGQSTPQSLRLYEHGYDIPGFLQGLDVLQFLSGSILGSLSKGDTTNPAIADQINQGYQKLGLDALIVVGGDGSLDIIGRVAEQYQWPWVAIPKTIDNDVPHTDRSVGFDTAVQTVTHALYDLTFTAASHDRVMIVQVMGRDAGHLALHAGIAGGADIILIPELVAEITAPIITEICENLAQLRQEGRRFALVVVAEGVKHQDRRQGEAVGDHLADQIKIHSHELCSLGASNYCDLHGVDTRVTVLGHLQRSGTPTALDRILGTSLGVHAVDLLSRGQANRLVVWTGGKVDSLPLDQVLAEIRQCHEEKCCAAPVPADSFLVRTARSLGIYMGPLIP